MKDAVDNDKPPKLVDNCQQSSVASSSSSGGYRCCYCEQEIALELVPGLTTPILKDAKIVYKKERHVCISNGKSLTMFDIRRGATYTTCSGNVIVCMRNM